MNTATEALLDLLRGRRAVILCGAGCSTESGIPDYRGTGAPRRRAPVQYQEFIGGESARARYWSRSAVGWPRMRASRPNDAHRALVRLERGGAAAGIITQNVDGLHHAAGSRRVVELHGSLAAVRCLDCGVGTTRDAFQARLLALNAEWAARIGMPASPDARRGAAAAAPTAPDGDAEVPATAVASFRVPACEACGGIMKPDVVFFGENVPADRVADAWRVFEEGDVLLVVGSSLAVYSGRRFVYRACRDGVPIAVINQGPTRADEVAAVKVEARLGSVLPAIADALL
jgi:NAD+-dependent protein deacetylase sirtuin 4